MYNLGGIKMNLDNLTNQTYNVNQKNILELQCVLNQVRKRAEDVGLTKEDIQKEIEKTRQI